MQCLSVFSLQNRCQEWGIFSGNSKADPWLIKKEHHDDYTVYYNRNSWNPKWLSALFHLQCTSNIKCHPGLWIVRAVNHTSLEKPSIGLENLQSNGQQAPALIGAKRTKVAAIWYHNSHGHINFGTKVSNLFSCRINCIPTKQPQKALSENKNDGGNNYWRQFNFTCNLFLVLV